MLFRSSLHQLLNMLAIGSTNTVGEREIVIELLTARENGKALISRFVQMLPLAIVGPYALKGYHFANPLELNKANELRPSSEFINFLKSSREGGVRFVNRDKGLKENTCTGCPLAGDGTDILAKIYLEIFKKVSIQNTVD